MLMKLSRIIATGAMLTLVACSTAPEAVLEAASVERVGEGEYQITWSPADRSIAVYATQQSLRTPNENQKIAAGGGNGQLTVRIEGAQRPYFYLKPENGHGLWTAERVLPLQGGRNFRDLGGYKTTDGHTVKWGKIFRSGSMANLTVADFKYLDGLGIKVVCDLRTSGEREHEPNNWVQSSAVDYWTRDYEMSGGDLAALSRKGLRAEDVKNSMISGYKKFPMEQAPAYREIFRKLAAGTTPLALNCSAGKDRAGLASALILSTLGVSDEIIIQDYAMTDRVLDRSKMVAESKVSWKLPEVSKETLAPIFASDPDYLKSAFAEIRSSHGSVDGYVRNVLGISEGEIESMRKHLLM